MRRVRRLHVSPGPDHLPLGRARTWDPISSTTHRGSPHEVSHLTLARVSSQADDATRWAAERPQNERKCHENPDSNSRSVRSPADDDRLLRRRRGQPDPRRRQGGRGRLFRIVERLRRRGFNAIVTDDYMFVNTTVGRGATKEQQADSMETLELVNWNAEQVGDGISAGDGPWFVSISNALTGRIPTAPQASACSLSSTTVARSKCWSTSTPARSRSRISAQAISPMNRRA